MANDIRISGTKLEFRDASNNVTSFEGNDIGNGGTAGSIRINTTDNLIEYVDRSGNLVKRQLGREFIGTDELATPRSLYVANGELRYVAEGETPFDIYKVVNPLLAPSAQPSNLSVTVPPQDPLQPEPYKAQVDWTNNTNNGDHIRVKWYQNGVLRVNTTVSTTSTTHVTSQEYWYSGDTLKVEVFYENSTGAGPVSSLTMTV